VSVDTTTGSSNVETININNEEGNIESLIERYSGSICGDTSQGGVAEEIGGGDAPPNVNNSRAPQAER
jgi:hypothetical protein